MATNKEKAKERIPFGKNGIKDGNGKVIRTDHASMSDVISDAFDGTPSRHDNINKVVDDAVRGVDIVKKKQDELAKIKRRSN